MSVSTRSVAGALAEIVGAAQVARGTATNAIDGCPPRWAVRPRSLGEVAAVVALASDEGLAVVPRGSGSALDLGRPPQRVDIVLDLRGLDRILEYNPDDLTVTVEAGLTAGALATHLRPRRQWLPVDPPGWAARTLGGLVATNASGPLRARYGTLRDFLLGVRFVQADGVLTWGGARVVKSVTGYDVPKLMVGALGTLGVLGELTLRLHPTPECEQTWLAGFPSADAAQAFVLSLLDSTIQPNRVEFLNEPALRACRVDPAPAAVVVAIGSVEAAVREQGARTAELIREAGGEARGVPEDFWARHDRAFARGEGEVALQVASLPSRLAETARALAQAGTALGSTASAIVTACAALGTFRVLLGAADPVEVRRLVERLRGVVGAFGGSVVVQGGPPALREALDPWGPVAPGPFALMREVKETFDRRRVLNPGRFVGGL